MEYHKTVEKIKELLKEKGIEYKTFEHEAVRTSEEANSIRPGYSLAQGAKALIVRLRKKNEEDRFVMLVLPGDKKFDSKKVKKLFGVSDVTFAKEDQVMELTGGVKPGGVPPFGNLFDLEVIMDPSLEENEEIIFNAGDRSVSIAMKYEDYLKVVKPRIEEIV